MISLDDMTCPRCNIALVDNKCLKCGLSMWTNPEYHMYYMLLNGSVIKVKACWGRNDERIAILPSGKLMVVEDNRLHPTKKACFEQYRDILLERQAELVNSINEVTKTIARYSNKR